MAGYIVKVERKYKDWIAKKSVLDGKPIYEIFEKILFPHYQECFMNETIRKITLSNDTSQLPLSRDFGKILRLEAIEKKSNVVSLVNMVFQVYLEKETGEGI